MPSDPLVLAFDTSAAHCAAALLLGDTVLAECHEDMARGQAERLMAMIDEVMTAGGAELPDLAVIGVGIGPGNFTGVRIAVSAARGLALALGRPAIGVGTLEAMAEGTPRPVLCTVDARRDRLYAQVFECDATLGPLLCNFEDVPVAGSSAIGERADELAGRNGATVCRPVHPLAVAIARIATRRLGQPDVPRPAPLYLRGADAAPPADPPPAILP